MGGMVVAPPTKMRLKSRPARPAPTPPLRPPGRHLEEFGPEDTCSVKMADQGQARTYRIFSHTGCTLLARDASPEISGEHLSALLRVIHRQIEQVRARARWEPNAA
ncbi:hypothetical protein EDC34_101235 [Thermomonas haemolytica]|uniref:Uncharacterized protein n=2 Tax=Thermomonas haemolytica TaxID=141949 RepID=A0A4R3NF94_9GAMM|nr:hypothetical protein EDC34_101235 [Thermomonas haemolytica]